jgi:hypothetical protein
MLGRLGPGVGIGLEHLFNLSRLCHGEVTPRRVNCDRGHPVLGLPRRFGGLKAVSLSNGCARNDNQRHASE